MVRALSPLPSKLATAEDAEAYDRWLQAEIESALHEAAAPDAKLLPHDEVRGRMEALIEAVEKRQKARRANSSE